MPTVVDYAPNTASGKILSSGDIDVDFTYGIPANAMSNSCILEFMVNTSSSSNLKVEAKLNSGGAPIFTYGPTSTNITRPFQKIFSGLKPGEVNKVTFRIVGGAGVFEIGDSVIWFHK